MRKWIWIVAIVVVLLVGGYMLRSGRDASSGDSDSGSVLVEGQDSGEVTVANSFDLQTSDDDFGALDEALESLG